MSSSLMISNRFCSEDRSGDSLNHSALGLINPALYAIASNPAKCAANFYDVNSGNTNQADPSVPGYAAGTGWDPVTGLGTPNAPNLIPDLVAQLGP